MADDDIYNNKHKYEAFKENLGQFALKPEERAGGTKKGKYYCKNKDNLVYFKKLFDTFEARDISYIRRNRLLLSMRLICHASEKNLKDLDRDDINKVVSFMHSVYKSPKSKSDFIIDTKHMWKILFPEKDEKGRIDDTLVPYDVRHLSPKIDKRREKRRGDKLTWEEFESIVKFFSSDPRMQFYLTLSLESLGRPQEILYIRLRDVELYDNYAKIWISEHGKEGTGFLQSIDSFPYVAEWYNKHPLKHDPNAFFFINLGDYGKYQQMKPVNINKHLRIKLKLIKVNKKVTCYSFKTNGVTFRRLRGDSDATIQHTARWTSTKQLKTYDYSQQDEVFKIELSKRGITKDEKYKQYQVTTKKCLFCVHVNGITDDICNVCKRPLNRTKIIQDHESKEKELEQLKKEIEAIKNNLMKEFLEEAKERIKKEVLAK